MDKGILSNAGTTGIGILSKLPARRMHFLHNAHALLFYTSTRAGFGLGFEVGHGFVISRLPYPLHHQQNQNKDVWSSPWLVSVRGIDVGAIAGVESLYAVVGIMTPRALKDLVGGEAAGKNKVAMATDYCVGLPRPHVSHWMHPFQHETSHPEVVFGDTDLCCAAVSASGIMVDIGVSGTMYGANKELDAQLYGKEATAMQVLSGGGGDGGGGIETPMTVPNERSWDTFLSLLRIKQQEAFVACFEPSTAATSEEEGGE